MGRPREYDERVAIQARVPLDLADRLRRYAAEANVSVNKVVIHAVDAFLASRDHRHDPERRYEY